MADDLRSDPCRRCRSKIPPLDLPQRSAPAALPMKSSPSCASPTPSLRPLIRADEYEDWPRGRIIFDQSKDRLVLYADRKLMLPGTIAQIQKRFSISAGQRRWRPTFAAKAMSVHENSRAMLSPRGLLSSAIPYLYGLRAFRHLPSTVCREDFHRMRIACSLLNDRNANPTNISPYAK